MAIMVATPTPGRAQEGTTYEGTFTELGGDVIRVCLSFSASSPGTLVVTDETGDSDTFNWMHSNGDKSKKGFIAADRDGAVALTGKVKGKGSRIQGDAVWASGPGFYFTYKADQVGACSLARSVRSSDPGSE